LIENNEVMKNLLGHILRVGNILNAGDAKRGQADGFEIESLSKAVSTKDKNNRSVLKMICEHLVEKNDE
jgi:hypothetical protein